MRAPRPIEAADKWANVAAHLSHQPEKDTVMAMLDRVTGLRRGAVREFTQSLQPAEARRLRGEAPAHIHEVGLQRRLLHAIGQR